VNYADTAKLLEAAELVMDGAIRNLEGFEGDVTTDIENRLQEMIIEVTAIRDKLVALNP
jgi:hypothetical protein